jgi:hypothetical protein
MVYKTVQDNKPNRTLIHARDYGVQHMFLVQIDFVITGCK